NTIAFPEQFRQSHGQPRSAKIKKRVVSRLAVSLLVASGLTATLPGRLLAQQVNGPDSDRRMGLYSSWLNSLSPALTVARGNIFLMTAADCPNFIKIFNSCFGNNPAAPYIIPQPPVGTSYVDPDYAEML